MQSGRNINFIFDLCQGKVSNRPEFPPAAISLTLHKNWVEGSLEGTVNNRIQNCKLFGFQGTGGRQGHTLCNLQSTNSVVRNCTGS